MLRLSDLTARSWTAGLTVVALGLAAVVALNPGHVADSEAQAVIDGTVLMTAVASALIVGSLSDSHRAADLWLFLAVAGLAATEFAFGCLPFLTGASRVADRTAGQLACEAGVAATFAAAAFTGRSRRTPVTRATAVWWAVAAFVAMTVFRQAELAIRGSPHPAVEPEPGLSVAIHHPAALAVVILAVALLAAAAVGFVVRGRRGDADALLLASASALLGAASIQHLVVEIVKVDWLTPANGLRLGAAGCLLAVGIRRYAAHRRGAELAVVTAERERIARDMHDGLVQDLAFIVSQGEVLASELGGEHPVTIAARRALQTSREAIADLSPDVGPTVTSALRNVAYELEHRFRVMIDVQIDPVLAPADVAGEVLGAADREELARIAQEAILNAVRHGRARHVIVQLIARRRELLLRVSDDGSGLASPLTSVGGAGLGLRAMRARADLLGGKLVARPGADGGTVVEVVIS
jgi:signal transduction histidine kinase